MADPIPFYAAPIPTSGEMPPGAIPVRVYGLDSGLPPIYTQDPVFLAAALGEAGWMPVLGPMQAFVGMAYGSPGQVLAMNSSGDGLEWVDMPTEPTEP